MVRFDPSQILAYAVSLVAAGLGIAVITNVFKIQAEPAVRTTFGVVFFLLAIYRFVNARMQSNLRKPRRSLWDE